MKTDVLIVGCGVAGLYCALNLPQETKVTIVTKNEAQKSDSFLAQGGICVLRDEEDFNDFFEDTMMKAGHYENNPESVNIMIQSSQDVLEEGYDVTKEPIPVVPSQHYFMGGIDVDYYSKTSMERLYAVGETACKGVHGKNRLASNSLIESLVFAKRAAKHIVNNYSQVKTRAEYTVDASLYEGYQEKYKELVLTAIEK